MEDRNDLYGYSSEWLKANTSINGWLTLFLFAIVIGGVVSLGIELMSLVTQFYANLYFKLADLFNSVCWLAISIYVVYLFLSRKRNAIFYARLYAIVAIFTDFVEIVTATPDTTSQVIMTDLRSIAWSGIWLGYLIFSDQVNDVIPIEFRKVYKRDWGILATIIVIPALLITLGFMHNKSVDEHRQQQETLMLEKTLPASKRTDGRIVFTIPKGFGCEVAIDTINKEPIMRFELVNKADSTQTCTISSFYDADASNLNFEKYWGAAAGQRIVLDFMLKGGDSGEMKLRGNKCFYRVMKHDGIMGNFYYSRFYMVFDDKSGKACVLSFADLNKSTGYVKEILNSLRFE